MDLTERFVVAVELLAKSADTYGGMGLVILFLILLAEVGQCTLGG